jgi:hypothetical protein
MRFLANHRRAQVAAVLVGAGVWVAVAAWPTQSLGMTYVADEPEIIYRGERIRLTTSNLDPDEDMPRGTGSGCSCDRS